MTERGAITHDLYNVRVRLDPKTLQQMQELARENERSLPAEIRIAVKAYLNGKGKP